MRNVIASIDASTAEATEALQEISLATPGRKSNHNNALASPKGGGKDAKLKYSGKAANDRKLKKFKKNKAKRL